MRRTDSIGANIPNPLLLDGPTGTELQRRGLHISPPLWSAGAMVSAPDLLEQIHLDYIEAGADVITANSFRTNRRGMDGLYEDSREAERLTYLAVDIARRARGRSGSPRVLIAGSDAPVEDCYSPGLVPTDTELRAEHEEHIRWLRDAGCDFILIETMNTVREALIACEAASMLEVPFMVSMVTDLNGENALGGESLANAVQQLDKHGPFAILANCSAPDAVLRATGIFAREQGRLHGEWRFGGYANGGEPDPVEGWDRVHDVAVEDFIATAERMLELGAGVVGSCCGTTPAYTRALRSAIGRQ